MPTPTPIGIAVVEHDGRYLVGERAGNVPLARCAEFPGGKCRPGEDAARCACRECLEETGLRVRPERLLLRREFEYPHGRVDLNFWLCRPVRSRDVAENHCGFRWLPAHELHCSRFPDANQPVLEMLAGRTAES